MRSPLIRLYDDEAIIDGFAGGGGASTGIEMALGRSPDVAINHDPIALAMHEANHPNTRHITSNIRVVRYENALPSDRRCGLAWFSPDCTYHSKARGGKPFRDPLRARRIRGLAWEAVRCVKALHPTGRAPRVIVLENVEEWRDWCPLKNGRPDPTKKGASFRRWKRELEKAGPGYVVELRELVSCDYGSPTKRKRLFVIARCDGRPIVWPEPTHGPGRALPYQTAAEHIDFNLPVPSIFLTPRQAKAWGKAHGVAAPKRPLALATKRRIARGIQRFVLDAAEPFLIKFHGEHAERDGEVRGQRLDEPLKTLDTSNRFALITPFLAPYYTERHEERHARTRGVDEPLPTITSQGGGKVALIAPTLINTRNGERKGQAPRVHDITAPFNTITAQGSQGALVSAYLAPVLVNNSETRDDRTYRSDEPIRTLTAASCRTYQLVAAFLAKHNAGHEATGQKLGRPIDTVTTRDSKALVTSHLLHLRGGLEDHPQTSQDVRQPIPTLTAGGTHVAEVRAFLVKYFGTKKDGRPVDVPLDTITTKERYALCTVTIGGEEYAIVDIGMRMLSPRELFSCQGFPAGYEIDHVPSGPALDLFGTKGSQKLTKKAQTRLVGNSVPPHVAAAIIGANLTDGEAA